MKVSQCYTDIIAGCGCLSTGLLGKRLTGLFAVEKNKNTFHTLKYNFINSITHFFRTSLLAKTKQDIGVLKLYYREHLRALRGNVVEVHIS